MNYKRLAVGILLSPILVPVVISILVVFGIPTLIAFGLEYVFTGKTEKAHDITDLFRDMLIYMGTDNESM